jgi:hypothetical protein
MVILERLAGRAEVRNSTVSTTETTWDWDWDGNTIDSSTPRAQVDPYAELRPMGVDESLTDLLFTARTTAEREPAPPTTADDTARRRQGALFEMV